MINRAAKLGNNAERKAQVGAKTRENLAVMAR